jgi:hypothetical protein
MSGVGPQTEQQQRELAQQQLVQAMSGALPQLVFNGFAHNFSASEITSILSFGPRPLALLIMPPVVAKSFAQSLLEIVNRYEAATGRPVGTIEELGPRIAKFVSEQQS